MTRVYASTRRRLAVACHLATLQVFVSRQGRWGFCYLELIRQIAHVAHVTTAQAGLSVLGVLRKWCGAVCGHDCAS